MPIYNKVLQVLYLFSRNVFFLVKNLLRNSRITLMPTSPGCGNQECLA